MSCLLRPQSLAQEQLWEDGNTQKFFRLCAPLLPRHAPHSDQKIYGRGSRDKVNTWAKAPGEELKRRQTHFGLPQLSFCGFARLGQDILPAKMGGSNQI
jgi:hypothetical protein